MHKWVSMSCHSWLVGTSIGYVSLGHVINNSYEDDVVNNGANNDYANIQGEHKKNPLHPYSICNMYHMGKHCLLVHPITYVKIMNGYANILN